MVKNKATFCFGLLISSCSFLSQAFIPLTETSNKPVPVTANVKAHKNQDAKEELLKKLKEINTFSANFNQKITDVDGNALQNAAGEIAVSKPNLVYWHTQTPDESLIVSDGSTLWLYDPFIEQASAYTLHDAIANTPILLLTSNDPKMWQNYRVSEINKTTFLVHANDVNSRIQSLELSFSKEKPSKLTSFTFLDASGQLSIINLSEMTLNQPQNKNLFKFTLPQGAHLDDQR